MLIGAPADIPRVLAHPSFANGSFDLVSSIAVDVEATENRDRALSGAMEHVRAEQIDTLLVAGEVGPATMRRIADIALAHHCEVLAMIPTEALEEHEPVIVWTYDEPLIQLAKLPRRPLGGILKRGLDIAAAAVGLTLSLPILAVLATLVVVESPGPWLFRHTRIGYRGRKFSCLKLRTMRPDAERVLESDPSLYETYRQNHYKIPDDKDDRVTRIGKFLRKTSLDELPQLWNVLRGDMSIVGPRPVIEEELRQYGDDRDLLLSVKPGLTGAWAVSGRQTVGYPERCALELGYVRNHTLSSDARIIAKTAALILYGFRPVGFGKDADGTR